MSKYAKITSGLIGAWLVASLYAATAGMYKTGPNAPPLQVGLAAVGPVVLFLLWFATSRDFRQFTMSLDSRILTFIQSWRIAGFVFLALAVYGILPKIFALPAGWGDFVIGATAPLIALKLTNASHRGGFIFWQILGIADLLTALTTAALAGIIDPHGIPPAAMTVLPLSIIPTFGVPLFLILHIICIAQARQWSARTATQIGEALLSRVL